MKITGPLAEPILAKLSQILDFKINIMDEKGVIVASTDPTRIDHVHEGAIQVIANKKPLIISQEDFSRYAGAKPGVNLPIEFLGEIIGVVGVTGDPEELYKFAKTIKITVEVMIQQVFVNNQLQYKNKIIENWLHDLIHPQIFDSKIVAKNGRHLLNLDFSKKIAIFLLYFPDLTFNGWKNLEEIMKLNERKDEILKGINREIPAAAFQSFIDNETCLVAIECRSKEVEEEKFIAQKLHKYFGNQKLILRIGIGNRYVGVEGYRDSYFQAKQSLELMRIFRSDEHTIHIVEWKLIRLLASIPAKLRKEFLGHYLSEQNKLSSELLHTLEVLFDAQLKMNDAAETLNIHRNTLQYRLDRIYKQVGLDPRKFNDAATLMTLLIFNKMEEELL